MVKNGVVMGGGTLIVIPIAPFVNSEFITMSLATPVAANVAPLIMNYLEISPKDVLAELKRVK
jgi:hypothetical protein